MRGTAVPIHVLFTLFTSGAAQTPTCNVSTVLRERQEGRALWKAVKVIKAVVVPIQTTGAVRTIAAACVCKVDRAAECIVEAGSIVGYRAGDARQKSSHGDSALLKVSDGQQKPSEEHARNHRRHHLCADRDEPIGTGPPTSLPPRRKTESMITPRRSHPRCAGHRSEVRG